MTLFEWHFWVVFTFGLLCAFPLSLLCILLFVKP